MLRYRKPKLSLIIFSTILVIILGMGLLFNPNNKSTDELEIGKYVEVESGLAWFFLKENNEFEFNRHIATSYDPRGTYSIQHSELIFTVNDQEEYRFQIDGEKLIFESGTYTEDLIKYGAVFQFTEEEE